jgi:hypothetical protein
MKVSSTSTSLQKVSQKRYFKTPAGIPWRLLFIA